MLRVLTERDQGLFGRYTDRKHSAKWPRFGKKINSLKTQMLGHSSAMKNSNQIDGIRVGVPGRLRALSPIAGAH